MKKILTSLLLIFIVSALLFSTVKIKPALATSFVTDDFEDGTLNKWTAIAGGIGFQIDSAYGTVLSETFESWNSNGWSIAGSGTQSDETGIVHGGSHSRKFVATAGQNIFIYKYDLVTTTLINATFYLYLPSDLNILSGQSVNYRKNIIEFFTDMGMDWGIWNNSGTIESYVIGIDTVYLTNGTLSLGAWHSISVAVNITNVGWMKLAIDGSLIWQRNGDFWDSDNTPSIYIGTIYDNQSPITCYIDDLTVIALTGFAHSGIYSAEGLASLGDGMYKQTASPPTTAYVTIWIYYNGSRTDAGDVRIVTLQNTTSSRGASIKHHLYTAGRDVLRLYDEWDGTSTDSSNNLTYNTWHKILFTVTSSNNTANLYVDDVLEASKTMALSNEVCNELDVYRDDATTGTYYYRMWVDDVDWSNGEEEPPTTYSVSFDSEPSGLFSVHFGAGGSWYWSPQNLSLTSGLQTFLIESGSLIRIVNDTWIYGFDHWSITNTTGTFNSTGSSVNYNLQENSSVIMAYTTIRIQVTASPALPAYFSSEYYGSNYSAPQTLNWNSGSHTFTALTHTYSPNSSYLYTFDHWLVNGTDQYGSLGITLSFTADTNLTIAYVGSTVTPPYPYTYVSGALNATWYFRSDTWTVHSILGYKLQTVNTATPAFDARVDAATKNVSYGVRVWALDLFGNQYELTSGSPVAVATKTTEGSEMMLAYWTCPAYGSMIDSIKVNLYQQFNDEGWSLRRIYVTGSDLLIRLPSASWTFHYYVNRTVGSTYSTFGFGSYTTYSSRIDLQYYKANPWDLALARLWQRNFVGFLFAPWTYWFGDLFWSIILFGCIVMAWMRTGSFKPVLALLWIIGGSGSILWALIPATALHIAVLMLALAMAITLFRLIYGRRT